MMKEYVLVVWLSFNTGNPPYEYYQEFYKGPNFGVCLTAKLRLLTAWIDREGVTIKKLECES